MELFLKKELARVEVQHLCNKNCKTVNSILPRRLDVLNTERIRFRTGEF